MGEAVVTEMEFNAARGAGRNYGRAGARSIRAVNDQRAV